MNRPTSLQDRQSSLSSLSIFDSFSGFWRSCSPGLGGLGGGFDMSSPEMRIAKDWCSCHAVAQNLLCCMVSILARSIKQRKGPVLRMGPTMKKSRGQKSSKLTAGDLADEPPRKCGCAWRFLIKAVTLVFNRVKHHRNMKV